MRFSLCIPFFNIHVSKFPARRILGSTEKFQYEGTQNILQWFVKVNGVSGELGKVSGDTIYLIQITIKSIMHVVCLYVECLRLIV